MSFDSKQFLKADLKPRTEQVPVEELKAWSDNGEVPVFTVRGLSGAEFSQVRSAVEKNRSTEALVKALAGGDLGKEAIAAVKELIGLGDKLPDDYVRMIELLILGTVEPQIDRQLAVRLATAYPLAVRTLTDKIMLLTGLGHEPGKPPGSGETKESATP